MCAASLFRTGCRGSGQVIEKGGDFLRTAQVQRGNLRRYGQAHGLDAWAVAAIEAPDEVQEGEEFPVEFFAATCWKVGARAVHEAAQDYPGEAGEPGRVEPDDQVGAGQAQVEGAAGIVAFADPGRR